MIDVCNYYTYFLAAVGAIVLFFFLLNQLWSVLQFSRAILAPYFLPYEETSLAKKYGSWALITGCTDGIGKAYATELAKRGINIVLVSRNEEKLNNVARQLESEHAVKTKIIAADFSLGEKAIEIVKSEIGELPIGILVNNVGKNYEYPMYLGEVPEKELWDIIKINVGAATLLSRALIGQMQQRGKGAIVNVSSGSQIQPLPLMTVYAATKAYLQSFSAALRNEYADSGITIQHLAPMFVNTKMNAFSDKLQEDSFLVPNATSYAKYAVATLGKMDQSSGYWTHGIQTFFVSIPPQWVNTIFGGRLNKIFRDDYLRKNKVQPCS